MRVGPICRTVQDTARILDVIAGYDRRTSTARSIGARRARAAGATSARSLAGLRIGVVREYLNRKLLAKADDESVGLVERAIAALGQLGATVIVRAEGALFQGCIARSAPEL
jgi:Asp-tRNA(Asn)/Glu-tRNA(Gln) amidotransferase A subunit family amidase